MLVATWNINGLRARLPFLLGWLAERRPDLVALQELKATEEQFPRAELEAAGYGSVVHAQAGWNGVAVLRRGAPAEALVRGLPGQEHLGARLVTARAEGLEFTSVYVPNGKFVEHPDFPLKLAWLEALVEHLGAAARAGRSAIVGGDFNLCPKGLDSWNEELLRGTIFHTDAERERFAALAGAGWHDLLRVVHPDLRVFSWWDYRAGAFHRGLGLRIDLLLGTPEVASRVRQAAIEREFRKKRGGCLPSDHAPVVVELG